MGMATVRKRETPKPRYKGTVVCDCCHAEYSPGGWCKGFYCGQDTSTRFVSIWKVKDGVCPNCGKDK